MFALDAIIQATMTESITREVPSRKVDAELGEGYGIYNGKTVSWAVLRFTPLSARWVASERWHPRQKSHKLSDGSLDMQIPFSDPRELVMDILRHGDNVRVISPLELKNAVVAGLDSALQQYND